jgi:hypothetical protein
MYMKTIFGNSAPLPGNDDAVRPMDLVMQLGRVRRFNGSANPEWTVLHHSVLCAILWLKSYGSEGVEHALMHDFHEYVTGDIPSPVKSAIGREHVEKVEVELDKRIYDMVEQDLPDYDKQFVKFVDWAALFIEAHYIGLPGHIKHMIDTDSILHLAPGQREAVAEVVRLLTPEVLTEMETAGFFTAPYKAKDAECKPDHEPGCPGAYCTGCAR